MYQYNQFWILVIKKYWDMSLNQHTCTAINELENQCASQLPPHQLPIPHLPFHHIIPSIDLSIPCWWSAHTFETVSPEKMSSISRTLTPTGSNGLTDATSEGGLSATFRVAECDPKLQQPMHWKHTITNKILKGAFQIMIFYMMKMLCNDIIKIMIYQRCRYYLYCYHQVDIIETY